MRYLIALLALAGIFDSCLALRIHLQDPSQAPPCSVSAKFDCGEVNHGRFAVFPPLSFDPAANAKIHIPVAVIGIAGYLLIAALVLSKQYWLTLQAAEIGFFFAAFLSYLEAYIIEKWCIYCLVSMGIITLILLLSILKVGTDALRRRQDGARAGSLSHGK
ncbi:MAG: vitamin K epoxide reductase family protein [Acidobacteriaceae bacterium]